jgi:hypothetical protein
MIGARLEGFFAVCNMLIFNTYLKLTFTFFSLRDNIITHLQNVNIYFQVETNKMLKKDVIEYFGGLAQTSRALRIHENSVRRWPDELTDNIQFKVELVTKGKFKSRETLLLSDAE